MSFGRRPNDSTYWLLKNPDTGEDKYEKNWATSMNILLPDWEKNEAYVHRLKQDTKLARALGKIHSEWYKWDTYPLMNISLGLLATGYSLAMLIKNRNNFSAFSNYEKKLYSCALIFGMYAIPDSFKYILTGRHLFEPKGTKITTQQQEHA